MEIGFAALTHPLLQGAEFHIFGAPLPGVSDYLPALALEMGVAGAVKFRGKLPREELMRQLALCDVLFHPSGREGASGTVGEATAIGLPVVCFASTGAASVLEACKGAGIVVDAARSDAESIAAAIVEAASRSDRPTNDWFDDRIKRLQQRLVANARQRLEAEAHYR